MFFNLCPIMAAIEANAADTPIGDFENVTVADKPTFNVVRKLWHTDVFYFQALAGNRSFSDNLPLMNLAWGAVRV